MFFYILCVYILLNVICDFNYLFRTLIAVVTGPFFQRKYSLNETTSIYVLGSPFIEEGYRLDIITLRPIGPEQRRGPGRLYLNRCKVETRGICTFQDCDITLKHMRIARILRDLDFARYHFYERTGIFRRSRELNIKSLQGCTLTITEDPVPLFGLYKINTKLVYWDDRSLFLEHEVITLRDNKVRSILVSRQHAIGKNGDSSNELLQGLPGFNSQFSLPEYLEHWLRSMEITSDKLKRNVSS